MFVLFENSLITRHILKLYARLMKGKNSSAEMGTRCEVARRRARGVNCKYHTLYVAFRLTIVGFPTLCYITSIPSTILHFKYKP